MSLESKAAILSVGTELTSGELVNSNAAWLSEKLEELGLEVVLHLTVPDEGKAILEALEYVGGRCRFMFVTGGLGPTKDDFTRDWVAKWTALELELDETCLQRLEKKFRDMGRKFHEFQRQQCYFPRGAVVHPNGAGTADGFSLETDENHVWVLPGPPREIEYLWQSSVEREVRGKIVKRKDLELRSWLCFGEGESAIADLVENTLESLPFQTGYRAHAPYVEVKIWGKAGDFAKNDDLRKLTEVLSPYLVSRKKETLSVQMINALPKDGFVHIWDGVSGGWFLKNLDMKKVNSANVRMEVHTFLHAEKAAAAESSMAGEGLHFGVFPQEDDRRFVAVMKSGKQRKREVFEYPAGRLKKYGSVWAVEYACRLWKEWLEKPS